MIMYIGWIIGSYLLGSICSAILVCQIMHKPDPRTVGSKNPGATNVLRCAGKTAALLTLVSDMAKGFLPTMLAGSLALPDLIVASIGLAALFGHLFPLYFGFKGGKGVATTFGIVYGLNIWLGLLATSTWLFTALLFRYSSLSALIMAAALPGYCYCLGLTEYIVPMSFLSFTVILAHYKNIKRLYHGQESKLGRKKQ